MSTISRLLKLIAPFKWWICLAVLLSFLTIGSSVGLMAISAYLISKAALATEAFELAIPITLVRLFAILRAGFRYLERYATHTATFRILTHLRVWFYSAIEPLAPARLMTYRSGDLLSRIVGDIETLENFYVRVVVPPVAAVLVTVLACLILGSFSPILAAALLVFLVLTGVVLPLAAHWAGKQPAGALVATRSELNALLVDQVQGLADLLSFDLMNRHLSRTLALSSELNRVQERMAMLRGGGNALAVLFTSLAGATVLGLAVPLVSSSQIDGVFLALLPLTAIAAFEAVQPLSLALQQLEANQAAARRLFELIDAKPAVVEPPTSEMPADASIELRDVRFSYGPGEPLALDGISLVVPPGGRAAIVGPSGSGKSTIVNLLVRFWDYQEGDIFIGGKDARETAMEDLRRLLAVVPQQAHLFNASIRSNMLLADAVASDEQIVAACKVAQIHEFIAGLPHGYDTEIGENGLLLSGGERQRLAIARAVLKNAPILILDEATANLDAVTERRLMDSLEPFMRGRTTLIIAHRPGKWRNVDQVLTLDNGRMASAAGR